MGLSFYLWLMMSGGNDVIADKFDIRLNAMTWVGRIGVIILPPIAYAVTYRICLGLEMHDREVLEHGIETGTPCRCLRSVRHVRPFCPRRVRPAHATRPTTTYHLRPATSSRRVRARGRCLRSG